MAYIRPLATRHRSVVCEHLIHTGADNHYLRGVPTREITETGYLSHRRRYGCARITSHTSIGYACWLCSHRGER